MALERKLQQQNPTRTNIFLTETLDWYLDFHAIKTQRPKGKIIREAIELYLKECGYKNLDKIPRNVKLEVKAHLPRSEDIEYVLNDEASVRTTIFMTESLGWYLKVHALATRSKNRDIVLEAIARYFKAQGYRIKRIPDTLVIEYTTGTTIEYPIRKVS